MTATLVDYIVAYILAIFSIKIICIWCNWNYFKLPLPPTHEVGTIYLPLHFYNTHRGTYAWVGISSVALRLWMKECYSISQNIWDYNVRCLLYALMHLRLFQQKKKKTNMKRKAFITLANNLVLSPTSDIRIYYAIYRYMNIEPIHDFCRCV